MANVLNMIIEAYQDEITADLFYSQILVLSEDFEVVDAFAEARRDERQHARMIENLLVQLTRKRPSDFSPAPPEITDLREAVQSALEGELSDIEFYQEIINSTKKKNIRDTFWYIRQDEIVHAEKFAALLLELEENEAANPGYVSPFVRYNLKNL